MAKPTTVAKKPAHAVKAAKPAPPSKKKVEKSGAKGSAKAAKPLGKAEAKVAAKVEAKSKAAVKPGKPRLDLSAKVIHLIAEEMAIEEAELTPTASFKEDLNLDEIDVAELLMQAETAFGVHPFSEEDWESCETVDDFTKLVEKRVEAKRGRKSTGKE